MDLETAVCSGQARHNARSPPGPTRPQDLRRSLLRPSKKSARWCLGGDPRTASARTTRRGRSLGGAPAAHEARPSRSRSAHRARRCPARAPRPAAARPRHRRRIATKTAPVHAPALDVSSATDQRHPDGMGNFLSHTHTHCAHLCVIFPTLLSFPFWRVPARSRVACVCEITPSNTNGLDRIQRVRDIGFVSTTLRAGSTMVKGEYDPISGAFYNLKAVATTHRSDLRRFATSVDKLAGWCRPILGRDPTETSQVRPKECRRWSNVGDCGTSRNNLAVRLSRL